MVKYYADENNDLPIFVSHFEALNQLPNHIQTKCAQQQIMRIIITRK